MPMTTQTRLPRLLLLAALLPIAACSVFKPKPATRPTTPATRPATPATRPATPPQGQQPATPPTPPRAGTPAVATPTTPPAAGTPVATSAAPTTATARPAAPAPTAAEREAARAVRDSIRLAEATRPRRRSRVYMPLMVDLHSARVRSAEAPIDQGEDEASMMSIDWALQRSTGGGLGLAFRTIGGDDVSPDYMEAAFLMGSRKFALDLGAATRTGFDSLGFNGGGPFDSTYIFARGGFRSRANLGNTDFSVQLRALYYVGLPVVSDLLGDPKLKGWSGETGLSYTWKVFPLTVNLGYRIERFKVWKRDQEISSLTFGGGLLLGRRGRPAGAAPGAAPPPRTP